MEALSKAAEVISDPGKVARLMKDFGDDGQVDGEEFRPVFEMLRAVTTAAFV